VFENLLGQEEVMRQLKRDIESGELPKSLLFSGPPASGKLTAALELARVLSCQGSPGAAWNCACPACARHRELAHPDLVILGPRSFPEEIPAALDLLERTTTKASAYFFIRAIRKLEKRFDSVLYEGEESRLAKAAPLVRELEERLDLIRPEELGAPEASKKALKAALAAAETAIKLEALVPETTPVFQIRAVEYWARLAPSGKVKVIVIEEADRMLDASRNALLKILEEPPESLQFALVTSQRSALMATILSRVRPYAFKARSEAEEGLVLERIFKAEMKSEYAAAHGRRNAIAAYLEAKRAFPPDEARRRARSFLLAAAARRSALPGFDPALALLASPADAARADSDPAIAALADSGAPPEELGDAALAALASATKDFGQKDDAFSSSFRSFLGALAELLGEALRLPGIGPDGLILIGSWAALLRDARSQYETLNRSPGLLAESLLYAMGEA
jgi:DNA polymerase-3 subunit gamma/tau